MPRPDFPQPFIDNWEVKFQAMLANPADNYMLQGISMLQQAGFIKAESAVDYWREMAYTAYWLTDLLNTEGYSEKEIEEACFAHGQRCFLAKDVWQVAAESLDLFRRGELKPGPNLAEKVYQEHIEELYAKFKQRRDEDGGEWPEYTGP